MVKGPKSNAQKAQSERTTTKIKKDIKRLQKDVNATKQVKQQRLQSIQRKVNKLPPKRADDFYKSRVFMNLAAWIRSYINIELGTPPLPTPYGEFVQCHNLQFDFSLPSRYISSDGYVAFMTQPVFDKFLRIALPGTASGAMKDDSEQQATNHEVDTGATPHQLLLCLDKTLTVASGGSGTTELAPIQAKSTTSPNNSFHWSSSRKAWQPGLKIFPVGSITSGLEPHVSFKNTADSTVQAQAQWWSYDSSQVNIGQVTSAWIDVPSNSSTNLPFTSGQWNSIIAADYAVTGYFAVGIALRKSASEPDAQLPEFGAELHITLHQQTSILAEHLTFGTPLLWEDFGVLDVCCKDPKSKLALQAQYEIASHIKFGLYNNTIKNATALLAKGGLICCVQFAGGTHADALLENPETLFPYLGTMSRQTSFIQNFDNGQHYFHVPEKEQDWFFKQIVDNEFANDFMAHDVPKVVTAIFVPTQIGSQPIINLNGWIHYELLTRDISAPQECAPGNSLNQLDHLLKALRSVPQFHENPKHLKQIGDAIMSVVRTPGFKKFAMDLVQLGAEVLVA